MASVPIHLPGKTTGSRSCSLDLEPFILALVMVNDPEQRTMAGALGYFQGQWGIDVVLVR